MKIPDKYSQKAKRENNRSRAYYKFEEINKEYNILKNIKSVIDLGCSPGGWLHYLDNYIEKGEIYGIDILRVPRKNLFSEKVKIFRENFLNLKFEHQFELVISDMAPEFSGNKSLDYTRTHELNFQTIKFCQNYLKKRCNLIFKSFQNDEFEDVLKYAKQNFRMVKCFKPKSSRKESAEIYVLCFNKKEFS